MLEELREEQKITASKKTEKETQNKDYGVLNRFVSKKQ